MKEDTYTNTEADAAAHERLRGRDEDFGDSVFDSEAYWRGRERDEEWFGPAWSCANCDQPHGDGSPADGCVMCGWVGEVIEP